jgi:hypothetical protein
VGNLLFAISLSERRKKKGMLSNVEKKKRNRQEQKGKNGEWGEVERTGKRKEKERGKESEFSGMFWISRSLGISQEF